MKVMEFDTIEGKFYIILWSPAHVAETLISRLENEMRGRFLNIRFVRVEVL